MGISQVVNLLRIANNYLPSVEHRYNQLQKENNLLESIITNKSIDVQNLNSQVIEKRKTLDDIESEYRIKAAVLEGLQQQIAKMEAFVYNYKNNNEQHVEVIKSIENKISDFLSDKKAILKLAIFSVIESMRNTQKSTLPWSIITTIIKIHCHHQQEVKTPTAIYWTLGDK